MSYILHRIQFKKAEPDYYLKDKIGVDVFLYVIKRHLGVTDVVF